MRNCVAPQRIQPITGKQVGQRVRPDRRVVAVDQCAGGPVVDRDRKPADAGRDHRGAACLRLHRHQTEGLRIARHRNQIGRPVEPDQVLPGLRRQEVHSVADTQIGGQPTQPVGRGQAGTRRATGDHHLRGQPVTQQRNSPQQHVGSLERLDPADERHQRPAGQPETGPGRRPVAGGEQFQIHPGMHDVDPVRKSTVQRNQFGRLSFGVDDQPVRGVDHLLLTDRAQRRLRAVTVGQCGVLHRGQGVRGMHQRHPPAVGGQPAHLTGEPVVRMYDVVVARIVAGLGAQHPGGERAQLGRQVVFVQALERAGDHVAHRHPRRDGDHRCVRRAGGPGEDVDRDTAARQMQGTLQDVDVQPAGVPVARLSQRRGVDGQNGDAHTSILARPPSLPRFTSPARTYPARRNALIGSAYNAARATTPAPASCTRPPKLVTRMDRGASTLRSA